MLVQLSDDQRLFRDTASRFLDDTTPLPRIRELHASPEGFERAWWSAAGELGWFSMLVPEALGGGSVSGDGLVDSVVVAELLGRAVQPGPFTAHNVVAWTLAHHGTSHQQSAMVRGLVDGSSVAAWAPHDAQGNFDDGAAVQVSAAGDGFTLSGTRGFVAEAQSADIVLVPGQLDGSPVQCAVPLDTPGVTLTTLSCLDLSRRMAHVHLDRAVLDAHAVVPVDARIADEQLHHAAVLTTADTVGAMGALLEMSVAYAKDRVAFGRPIGAFQAIKHLLADQALALEAARAAVVAAARSVAAGDADASEVVSMTAAYVGDVGTELAQEALQVHGGIGYTWEHDLHLLLRRIQFNTGLYGSPTWHRERVCAAHQLGEGSSR